jgi:putative FmdB family regulatory protein
MNMPTYIYRCQCCAETKELEVKYEDRPENTTCDSCSGICHREFISPQIIMGKDKFTSQITFDKGDSVD